MERVNLETQLREETGKQLVKRLRGEGFIPAIVYKGGKDNMNLKVSEREFVKIISTKAGANVIINLRIADKKVSPKPAKDKTVMIKEIQREPVKGKILHIDFNEISLTETLKVKVPIMSKGEAVGVKQEGGVLQHIMWEADVECLPTNIPDKIEVDVTNLKIGGTLSIKDILPPEGVKILGDPESIVFSVEHVKTIEEVAAAPVEGESLEPELIREKKEKEEAEEEEKAEAPKAEKKEEKK